MRSYAITGATGLLGKALSQRVAPDATFSGDIRDFDHVERWVNSLRGIDAIVHFAAVVPKQIVDANPTRAQSVNVSGTLNLLEAMRRLKALGNEPPWLLYASTSHVYAPSKQPLKEGDPRVPFTIYGLTKLQGEQWCEAYTDNFCLPVCMARIFSFSAPQQPDYYFLPAMAKKIRQAKRGAQLTIPGVQGYRDFLRVSQICDAISALADGRFVGAVNIGTGAAHKLSDLVLKMARVFGRDDLQFEFAAGPEDALVADPSTLRNAGMRIDSEIDALIAEIAKP